MHLSHLANANLFQWVMHRKTKLNLETKTAEMEKQGLKAVINMVEISPMADLHR